MLDKEEKEWLAKDLVDGVEADIWYDAKDHGDAAAEKVIGEVQAAMLLAARLLLEDDPKSICPDDELPALASTLRDGAGADVWYDALAYGDLPGQERIDKTTAALTDAADWVAAIAVSPKPKSSTGLMA